jgi:hypothetical protein
VCHICKNTQKAIQNTYTRLLTIIGISGPLPFDGKNVPDGRLSHIQVTYHRFIPVLLGAGDSQMGAIPMALWRTTMGNTGTTRTVNIEDRSCGAFIVRS